MKKVIDFIYKIKPDKLLHFIAGMIVGAIGAGIGAIMFKDELGFSSLYGMPVWLFGIMAGAAAGMFKEVVIDLILKFGTYDFYDIVYTFLGSVVTSIMIWILVLIL